MFKDKSVGQQADRFIEIAKDVATSDKVKRQIRHIRRFVGDFVEPGYSLDDDEEIIIGGNWNNHTEWEDGDREVVDDTIGRLADILQRIGCRIVWDDEWESCYGCQGVVRITGDSYAWKPYHKVMHGGMYCADCIKEDFEQFMDEYVNNPETAVTFDIDLEEYGFEQFNGQFENGMYQHQMGNPRPEEVFEQLQQDYRTVIFKMDSTGQFDTNWSVWVKDKYEEEGGT
jgi:hypothetical protein